MVFLDITWGETFVLTGLGFALIGRKDLPKAAHFLGAQVGRVVGFLQGVRVRADRFTEHHEIRALHNELRSGLRELDAVRVELATAASSRGIVGRGLQSPVGVVQGTSLYSQQNQQQPVGLATLRAIQHIETTVGDTIFPRINTPLFFFCSSTLHTLNKSSHQDIRGPQQQKRGWKNSVSIIPFRHLSCLQKTSLLPRVQGL
jgi:hypothetical protein